MAQLHLPDSMATSLPLQRLAAALECDLPRAVGLWVLFLTSTQAELLEAVPVDDIARHVVAAPRDIAAVVEAFCSSGLLTRGELELGVPMNAGIAARRDRLSKNGQKGQAARAKKPKAKARKADPELALTPAAAAQAEVETRFKALCRAAWAAYAEGYRRTTRQAPPDNAKARTQIQTLCKQLGQDTPAVLAFYTQHPSQLYAAAVWPLGLALRDAPGLHTQWLNKQPVTPQDFRMKSEEHAYLRQLAQIEAGEL